MRKFRFPCFAVAVGLIGSHSAFGEAISWKGGDGTWSNAAAWSCAACSPATYPNNGNSGLTFAVAINPASTANVSLDVNAAVNSVSLGANGKLTIATEKTLNVTGAFSSTAGATSVVGGSQLQIGGAASGSGAASLYVTDANSVVQAMGGLSGMASMQVYNRGLLNVSGLLSLGDAGSFLVDGIGTQFQAGSYAQNAGSKLGMSNQAVGSVSGSFANDGGRINLQSGSQLSAGSFSGSGSSQIFLTDPNTKLKVTGDLVNGSGAVVTTLQLTNGATVQVGGMLKQSGNFSADGIGTALQAGSFQQDSSSSFNLSNTAKANVSGSFVNAGVLQLQSGGKLTVTGDFAGQSGNHISLTDPDTLLQIGGKLTAGNVGLTNGAKLTAGSFEQTGDMSMDGIGTGFTVSSYTQDTSTALRMSNQAQGVVNGGFTNDGGTIDLRSGSSLLVKGDYHGAGGAFGIDASSSAHVMGDFYSSGMFQLGLGSSTALEVDGNITLDGLLQVNLDGKQLTENSIFRIITFTGSDIGGSNFASFLFPTLNGLTFREVVGAHEIDLQVVSADAPEPSTLLLGCAGLVIAGTLRRSRKK